MSFFHAESEFFTSLHIWLYIFSLYHLIKLVEALRYKPEDCGFLSQWCHWNFSLT